MCRSKSRGMAVCWLLAAGIARCGGGLSAAPPAASGPDHGLPAVELPAGLDPARWPGVMPKETSQAFSAWSKVLAQALNARDAAQIRTLIADMRRRLGPYAGAPEVQPAYDTPVETSPVPLDDALALCRKVFDLHQGRNGWEVSQRAKAQGGAPQRLRVSFRTAVSDLRLFEAGGSRHVEYRDTGVAGLQYIAGQQTSVGVFGYPYNPQPVSKVQHTMLALVREGEKRGRKMVEGDWCIDDLGEGGLQFDNGEAGAGLLYAYALTGERRFLDAARRAAEWASRQPLVANWNYNSFSGALLARLYRVTGEATYLDAAKIKFAYGVLPGQMENGRWFDPHNARPQYHAVLARNLVEYALALKQAGDPQADAVRRHAALALDSLAEETLRFGPSNVEEGLPLEALVVGLLAFGPEQRWERAAHAYAHCLVDRVLPQAIASRRSGVPETLPAYVLWREVCAAQATSREASLRK